MKNLSKLSLMILLVCGFVLPATQRVHAGEPIRLDGGGYMCLQGSFMGASYEEMYFEMTEVKNTKSRMSCERQKRLERFAGGVAVSLHIASVGLACTGFGSAAALGVEVAALGVHVIEFSIGLIDCSNTKSERETEQLIDAKVCDALMANGISCDPKRLKKDNMMPRRSA